MKVRRLHSLGGFTLIELLVVLAIIATISAIVVPTFLRSGAFAQNDAERAARDLSNLLTAARMYAGTFRVDTAVVYAQRTYDDPVLNVPVRAADAIALARRVNDDELKIINDASSSATKVKQDDAFVLVGGENSVFRPLSGQTCVLPKTDNVLHVSVAADNWTGSGFVPVALYRYAEDGTLEAVEPRSGTEFEPEDTPIPVGFGFPAHVFTSEGLVRTDSSLARLTVNVALSPEAPAQERFGLTDDESGQLDQASPLFVKIEIYTTMGRVEIADR